MPLQILDQTPPSDFDSDTIARALARNNNSLERHRRCMVRAAEQARGQERKPGKERQLPGCKDKRSQ